MMTIKLLENNSDILGRWDEYVDAHDEGHLYHRAKWKEIIESTFGHRCYYFYAVNDSDKICGVFPVTHLKSRLFGNYAVSVPYFNYGGVLADSGQIADELLSVAVDELKGKGISHLEIREQFENKFEMPVKTSKVSMWLDLPDDADVLFKKFTAKLRSQIRRPAKEGMTFSSGGVELVNDFYDVFAENMRDLGTPVYTKSLFKNVLNAFPEQAYIGIVYFRENPVAAGFVIGNKNMMEIPWASTIRAYNRFSPNMMLYWGMLQLAIEKQYSIFDFGRSTPGEGTYRFKKQWGTYERPLYWYYWLKEGGDLPEINPHNPKYQFAIAAWQKLPLALTKMIGPSIVKNLP